MDTSQQDGGWASKIMISELILQELENPRDIAKSENPDFRCDIGKLGKSNSEQKTSAVESENECTNRLELFPMSSFTTFPKKIGNKST